MCHEAIDMPGHNDQLLWVSRSAIREILSSDRKDWTAKCRGLLAAQLRKDSRWWLVCLYISAIWRKDIIPIADEMTWSNAN